MNKSWNLHEQVMNKSIFFSTYHFVPYKPNLEYLFEEMFSIVVQSE